jgi:hypothetical protein
MVPASKPAIPNPKENSCDLLVFKPEKRYENVKRSSEYENMNTSTIMLWKICPGYNIEM